MLASGGAEGNGHPAPLAPADTRAQAVTPIVLAADEMGDCYPLAELVPKPQ